MNPIMWDKIYDMWIMCGELRHLLRIHKIKRYLEHGRIKTVQESDNLVAQLIGLLELQTNSAPKQSVMFSASITNFDVILNLTKPIPNVQIPALDNTTEIATFLENTNNIRIKPQPTEDYPTHPLWILWNSIAISAQNNNHRTALWLYREVLLHYINRGLYTKAAQVVQYALHIRVNLDPLPLLHPYIIRKVMYVNIDK